MSPKPTTPTGSQAATPLSNLLQVMPDAALAVDGGGRIRLVNELAGELFGWTPVELEGQRLEELIPEHFREGHEEHFRSFLAAPKARPMGTGLELAARRRDGSEFPVDISLRPWAEDESSLVIAAIRDLSGQRRFDQRHRSFVENSSEAIWCMEFDDGIPLDLPEDEQLELLYRKTLLVEVNEAFATTYQTPRGQIVGNWRLQNFLPRSLPTSEPFVLETIRAGYQLEEAETNEQTEEGLDLVFVNNTTPVIEDGKLVRLWGASRDVTELRARQRELEELKERLEAENIYLQEELQQGLAHGEIVGEAESWRHVMRQIRLVAGTDSTVLITGETGTGKELLARALQKASDRSGHPLIKVNCAALPSTLIESELFGHEKGAFSGADAMRKGRCELADQGTLFLDEIGELPLELQAKLLQVLQNGEFERLGSAKTRHTDVRVIAATNRDLKREVEEGLFRSDLYYRLAVFPIEVPPLRERREDIQLLALFFLAHHNAKHSKTIESIPRPAMTALESYDWPGNVRELENLIERCVILSAGSKLWLDAAMLGGSPVAARPSAASPPRPDRSAVSVTTSDDLQEVERSHITAVLEACGWKVKGAGNAADRLGLKESTLRSRMKKLGIRRPGT